MHEFKRVLSRSLDNVIGFRFILFFRSGNSTDFVVSLNYVKLYICYPFMGGFSINRTTAFALEFLLMFREISIAEFLQLKCNIHVIKLCYRM